MKRVVHKLEQETIDTGMPFPCSFAFISWFVCRAGMSKESPRSIDWKQVTCKRCLKKRGKK